MPSTRRSAAASGSSSRKKTRSVADEEAVVTPEEGDAVIPPSSSRSTLRKRSAGARTSSAAGSLSERTRRKMKKEAEAVVSAPEDAEEEDVEVLKGGAEEDCDSLLRPCGHRQDALSKRSSSSGPSPAKLSTKRPRKEEKRDDKGIAVSAVDEAASEEEILEVEEEEVGFEEEGVDGEAEGGDEVRDAIPKRRVATARKSAEGEDADCRFIGQPIDEKDAKKQWPKRYQGRVKVKVKGEKELIFASSA